MGTREENNPSLIPPNSIESEFDSYNNNSPASSSYYLDPFTHKQLDDALVKDFEGVATFKDYGNEDKRIDNIEGGRNYLFPFKPSAEDCTYYLRTGRCKFGLNCKFNHSGRKAHQLKAVTDNERGYSCVQKAQIECKYYLTTEGCKYGKSCRYSHSKERSEISLQEINPCSAPSQLDFQNMEKETEAFAGQTLNIECKYYLTTGGCRYGIACRYKHSKEEEETNPPDLNFLGLPIRLQEKECEFYMRTGSCGYGVTCRFHHPDPVGAEVSRPFKPTCGTHVRGHSLRNHHLESYNSKSKWSSVPDAASLSSHELPHKTVPWLDNDSYHAPGKHSFLEQRHQKPGWSHKQAIQLSVPDSPLFFSDKISLKTVPHLGYHLSQDPEMHSLPEKIFLKREWNQEQDAASLSSDKMYVETAPGLGPHSSHAPGMHALPQHQEKTGHSNLSSLENKWIQTVDVSANNLQQIQGEEFPERPDTPECIYFTTTGACRYRSACRYHHPENQASNVVVCALNNKGLPLRPDRSICRHYARFGICKSGMGCLHDHPEHKRLPSFQLDAFLEPSSGSNHST